MIAFLIRLLSERQFKLTYRTRSHSSNRSRIVVQHIEVKIEKYPQIQNLKKRAIPAFNKKKYFLILNDHTICT